MANITSIWIKISDSNGNEALEVLEVDLKNAALPLTVDFVTFYEKGEDGISRKLESHTPANKFIIAE